MEKKQNLLVITIAVLASLLTVTYIVGPASALVDFNAYKGDSIPDTAIDGTLGDEWDDAGNYTGVAIDPQGTAEIWTKHDETYLYIAIRFTADSDNPWVALQLGTVGCMDASADVSIFGDDNLAPNGYSDAYFSGFSVVADATQDGVGAIDIGTDNTVTIELKKPLNSGDSDGNDIAWTQGDAYTLVIAWDSDGGGSSGGSVSHTSGTTPTARTILINPNPKTPVTPENNPPTADFGYAITELTVKFTDYSIDPDHDPITRLWKFGDETNSTETNPNHTYSDMGEYTVTLTITDDKEGSDITSKTFMVPPAEQRMQLWITQVAIITIAIAFVSFTAVLTARKIGAKKEEGK